ncbi:MAG: hypothetical protein FD167_3459 [bacterium]|nr:MAG: hypothetical protein FD167_3459 [bacterium]
MQAIKVIFFIKNRNPQIAKIGPLRPLGSTLNYKRTGAPATSDQPQDSARVKFLTALISIADQVSMVLNQVHNAELQALAAGAPSQSFSSQYNAVGFGGALQKVGFIAVTENPNGDLNVDIVPEAFVTSGLDKDLAIGAAGGLAITAIAFPDESAFPTGYSGTFRQASQQ